MTTFVMRVVVEFSGAGISHAGGAQPATNAVSRARIGRGRIGKKYASCAKRKRSTSACGRRTGVERVESSPMEPTTATQGQRRTTVIQFGALRLEGASAF